MHPRLIACALAAGLLAVTAAAAQTGTRPTGPGAVGPTTGYGDRRGPAMGERMEAHRRMMAEHLRAVLQLRPDQEAGFTQYAAALEATRPHRDGDRARREGLRGQGETLTVPQRLDRMQARMQERQTRFARVADATRRFYAGLSPAQQRAMDALGGEMHGRGRHAGGGPRWGGSGWGRAERGGQPG